MVAVVLMVMHADTIAAGHAHRSTNPNVTTTTAATPTAAAAARVIEAAQFIAQYPRYRTDTGHVVLVANAFGQQSVTDLPRKDARILLLQLSYVSDHLRCGHARLRSTDGTRQNRTGLMVSGQNLRHAAVADAQLPGNVTRPDAESGQFDDAHSRRVGQRSTVDENASQLVDFAVLLRLAICKSKYA